MCILVGQRQFIDLQYSKTQMCPYWQTADLGFITGENQCVSVCVRVDECKSPLCIAGLTLTIGQ